VLLGTVEEARKAGFLCVISLFSTLRSPFVTSAPRLSSANTAATPLPDPEAGAGGGPGAGGGNTLDVRFRFGSALPNFQDLGDRGSVRTELREH